jgi:hypothetical protein
MTRIEGIDYSGPYPGAPAIMDAGKVFVVRYLARDERGITKAEYDNLIDNGIGVVFVYESTADRPSDGYDAGVYDARYAYEILTADLDAPPATPIYVNCDDTDDQVVTHAQLRSYLNGVQSVIGFDRTGGYGSVDNIRFIQANGLARWYWQTYAWSRGEVADGIHLLQYLNGGITLNGTVCDLDAALQEHYGQVQDYDGPAYATPSPKVNWLTGTTGPQSFHGVTVTRCAYEVTCKVQKGAVPRASVGGPASGPKIAYGEKRVAVGTFKSTPRSKQILLLEDSSRVLAANFSPRLPL